MKIKNKYVFRSIISELLYFQKKKRRISSVAARLRYLGLNMPKRLGFSMTIRPRCLESGMTVTLKYPGCYMGQVSWVWHSTGPKTSGSGMTATPMHLGSGMTIWCKHLGSGMVIWRKHLGSSMSTRATYLGSDMTTRLRRLSLVWLLNPCILGLTCPRDPRRLGHAKPKYLESGMTAILKYL
jgi:hypothetical protein